MVRVLGIGGSLRDGSYSMMALRHAMEAAAEEGAETTLFDLAVTPLPFCGALTATEAELANVVRLRELALAADAFLLATPEYHGSFSGVLKNALDHLSFEQMEGKAVGLLSVLGGQSNSNALNHLRLVCRWVHAWVIPQQVAIGGAYQAFDEAGVPADPEIQARVQGVGREVVRFSHLLKNAGHLLPAP